MVIELGFNLETLIIIAGIIFYSVRFHNLKLRYKKCINSKNKDIDLETNQEEGIIKKQYKINERHLKIIEKIGNSGSFEKSKKLTYPGDGNFTDIKVCNECQRRIYRYEGSSYEPCIKCGSEDFNNVVGIRVKLDDGNKYYLTKTEYDFINGKIDYHNEG